jgi:hypothetical protein
MFRFGSFIVRLLLALVLIGLLVAGGTALYRAGWANGYQAAAVSAGNAGKAVTPPVPYFAYPPAYFGPGYFYPGFFPFGPLLGIGFFLLVFFLIGGIFRFAFYRRWAGKYGSGGPYGPGGWGHHFDPDSPWAKEWRERHKAEAEKGEGQKQPPAEA